MGNITDNFEFPVEAQDDFISKGLVARRVDNMVSDYNISGHDQGVGYRFFVAAVKNAIKSEPFDFDINDEEDMIEWYVNKKNMPTEKVRFLPEKLLKFSKIRDEKGQLVPLSGLYCEAFKAWKKGMCEPGLSLSRWDQITVGQVHSFASAGVFSVQQLAAMPRDRVQATFPKNLVEVFEKAVRYVNAQTMNVDVKKYADEIAQLKQEKAKQDEVLRDLSAKVADITSGKKPGKGRKSSKNAVTPVLEETLKEEQDDTVFAESAA